MFAKGKKHGSRLIPSLHCARMTSQEQGFHDFAAFAAKLKGDEKLGAEIIVSRVSGLRSDGEQHFVTIVDGEEVAARAIRARWPS